MARGVCCASSTGGGLCFCRSPAALEASSFVSSSQELKASASCERDTRVQWHWLLLWPVPPKGALSSFLTFPHTSRLSREHPVETTERKLGARTNCFPLNLGPQSFYTRSVHAQPLGFWFLISSSSLYGCCLFHPSTVKGEQIHVS